MDIHIKVDRLWPPLALHGGGESVARSFPPTLPTLPKLPKLPHEDNEPLPPVEKVDSELPATCTWLIVFFLRFGIAMLKDIIPGGDQGREAACCGRTNGVSDEHRESGREHEERGVSGTARS